jgi:hypothetical protein
MEQSPSSEVKSFSARQENPQFMEPEVHYRILNFPPPVPILSQNDKVHALQFTS